MGVQTADGVRMAGRFRPMKGIVYDGDPVHVYLFESEASQG